MDDALQKRRTDNAVNVTANRPASEVLRSINLEIRVEDWFGLKDFYDINSPRFTIAGGFTFVSYFIDLLARKKHDTEFGGAIKGQQFYVYVYSPHSKFRNGICPVLRGKVEDAGRSSKITAKIRMNPLMSFTLKFLIVGGILMLGFCFYMINSEKKPLSPEDVQTFATIFSLWFIAWPVAFWLIHRAFAQDRRALCKFLEDIVR